MTIRVTEDLKELVTKCAEHCGMDVSEVVRRCARWASRHSDELNVTQFDKTKCVTFLRTRDRYGISNELLRHALAVRCTDALGKRGVSSFKTDKIEGIDYTVAEG